MIGKCAAVGLMMTMVLGTAGAVRADDNSAWVSFALGGKADALSPIYDLTLFGRQGQAHLDNQGFGFQLYAPATEQGMTGSTADGRVNLGTWTAANSTLSKAELDIWSTILVPGGTLQADGVYYGKRTCTINFTSDASGFSGTCGDAPIHGSRRVAPPPVIPDASSDWLAAHNSARTAVGSPALQWDTGLAATAKSYAQLMAERGTQAGDCRYGHNLYGYVLASGIGENIGASYGTEKTPAAVLQSFLDERPDFDTGTCTCLPGKVCLHYTQVVSQWSNRVGCGHASCKDGMGSWYFYVCNYQAPGNQKLPSDSYRKPYPSLTCPQ